MSQFENGILIGYENKQFVIGIFDEVFVEEELNALKRNTCTLSYLSKGLVDLFLINIEDSLETSDIPFCVHDFKEDSAFIQSLEETENYTVKVAYMDLDGKEIATRIGTMDSKMSKKIREAFKNNLTQPFDEEAYENTLARIQSKYEPFELEELADAVCKL